MHFRVPTKGLCMSGGDHRHSGTVKFLGTSFELSLIDHLLFESQEQKLPLVSENELTLDRLIELHLRCLKRKFDPNSI
ncbi:hypothetical protein L1987_49032 [Smallanthus sonchifolius]|uniref:Uncharacterized protein n=1 Tax=Smallanthus sonchifolius TaxID=185202 RepID=A0ACB9FUP7_9ASTR|nr:hypothetical protein L1987_49032 [Smallanthus sonchifolius]